MRDNLEKKKTSSWKIWLLACAFSVLIIGAVNFARTGEISVLSGGAVMASDLSAEAPNGSAGEIRSLTSAELYDLAYQVNPGRANGCAELGYRYKHDKYAYGCLYRIVKGGEE